MNSTSGTGSKSSSGNSSGKPKLASLTKGLSDLRVRTESMLDKITGAPEAQPSDAQWDRKVGRRTTADEMNEYNDDGPVLGAALSPTAGSLGRTQQASRGAKESLLGKKRVMNRSDEYYDGDYLNFKDFKKIIDEGAEYNCPSVEPQGNNEPFLIKNLHEYISYAYKKGFIDIMLNCNGSAITKKRSQKICDLLKVWLGGSSAMSTS